MAREMGFSHIQAATNGLMLNDHEFARRAKQAGLSTLYLQFDGVTDDVYLKMRGEPLFEKKMQTIESCRQAGIKIVFVPTIVKGINDDQLGDILRVAINNVDTVSGISFQPVAFTGRISRRELEQKRFTLTDLAFGLSDQTGMFDKYDDWFPLSGRYSVLQADGRHSRHRRPHHLVARALLPSALTCLSMNAAARPCR